jgi:hypothetical protein
MEMHTKDSGPRGFWPQELCARETVVFARGLCKVLLFRLRDAKSCAREILSRELCKNVFLPDRCQKMCKRDSFKRVAQEVFFAREMSKAVQEKFF